MSIRLNKKALSEALRKLASLPHTIDDDGNTLTKEEVLAALVWKEALGYTEKVKNAKGIMEDRIVKPAAWAQQYIYERLDGKVAQVEAEEGSKITATERVRDLVKQRLNKLVK